jgi:hypothetical protein
LSCWKEPRLTPPKRLLHFYKKISAASPTRCASEIRARQGFNRESLSEIMLLSRCCDAHETQEKFFSSAPLTNKLYVTYIIYNVRYTLMSPSGNGKKSLAFRLIIRFSPQLKLGGLGETGEQGPVVSSKNLSSLICIRSAGISARLSLSICY